MNTTTNDDSLRDTLEKSFEEVVEAQTPDTTPAEQTYEPSDAEPQSLGEEVAKREYQRDEAGKFAEKAAADAQKAQETPAAPVAKEGLTPAPKAGQPPAAKDPLERAPQSWKPEERESWGSSPPAARSAIARHDALVQQTMRDSSEDRRFAAEIKRAVAPFEHFIKAEGSTSVAAIDNLMSTAARLRTSTAPELAQLVSGLITQFGVGRFGAGFIGQLDESLSGVAPRQENPEVTAMRDQMNREMQPFRQAQAQQEQQNQYMAQQNSQLANQEIHAFAANSEFINDVRGEMADILEMGVRRGQAITLEQAYNSACRDHPEIGKIMHQREQAKFGQNQNSNAQRARLAASSVGGAPSMGGSLAGGEMTLREQIEASMNGGGR